MLTKYLDQHKYEHKYAKVRFLLRLISIVLRDCHPHLKYIHIVLYLLAFVITVAFCRIIWSAWIHTITSNTQIDYLNGLPFHLLFVCCLLLLSLAAPFSWPHWSPEKNSNVTHKGKTFVRMISRTSSVEGRGLRLMYPPSPPPLYSLSPA